MGCPSQPPQLRARALTIGAQDEEPLDDEKMQLVQQIRKERRRRKAENMLKQNRTRQVAPRLLQARGRTIGDVEAHLEEMGVPEQAIAKVRGRSKKRSVAVAADEARVCASMLVVFVRETESRACSAPTARFRPPRAPATTGAHAARCGGCAAAWPGPR
jgi:hypothetical protein